MSDIPSKSKARQASEDSAVAIVSVIPVVGAIAAPFLVSELTRRHSAKRDAWLNDLERRLVQLQNEGVIDLASLCDNEKFLELVYFAIQEGQATLSDEKHQLLGNVVINYSQNMSMDDDKKFIFLKYIEQFTPSHLALLKLLSDPKRFYERANIPWPEMSMGGRMQIVNGVFSFWTREFTNLLFEDLRNGGLVQGTSLGGSMSGAGLEQSITSILGSEFLTFIRVD